MTDDALLGPVPRYAVTTVIGGSGLEAARLTAAIAISVTTGCEIVPGWKPTSVGIREQAFFGNRFGFTLRFEKPDVTP
jgi:hypothetical protein